MHVAQLRGVGEHLVAAGACGGAGGRERVADQNDAGLPMAVRYVEIGRPDLHRSRHLDVAGDPLQPRHQRMQRGLRRMPHLAQPRIVHVAIDHQVGAHDVADRKQRQVSHPIAGALGIVGQRGKFECVAIERRDIESNGDGMARADYFAFDAERVPQADVQSVGQHDQARRDFLTACKHDSLSVRAGGDRVCLVENHFDVWRNFGTQGVD